MGNKATLFIAAFLLIIGAISGIMDRHNFEVFTVGALVIFALYDPRK